MTGDEKPVAKVYDMAAERKKRRIRRPVLVDVHSMRIDYTGDGGLRVNVEAQINGKWQPMFWPVPADMAERIADNVRQTRAAAEAKAVAEEPAPPASAPERRRCKLTPEGYFGGKNGCRRRRGHDGEHDNGARRFTVACPHHGMYGSSGKPTAPACPWCHVALLPIPPRRAEGGP